MYPMAHGTLGSVAMFFVYASKLLVGGTKRTFPNGMIPLIGDGKRTFPIGMPPLLLDLMLVVGSIDDGVVPPTLGRGLVLN